MFVTEVFFRFISNRRVCEASLKPNNLHGKNGALNLLMPYVPDTGKFERTTAPLTYPNTRVRHVTQARKVAYIAEPFHLPAMAIPGALSVGGGTGTK